MMKLVASDGRSTRGWHKTDMTAVDQTGIAKAEYRVVALIRLSMPVVVLARLGHSPLLLIATKGYTLP